MFSIPVTWLAGFSLERDTSMPLPCPTRHDGQLDAGDIRRSCRMLFPAWCGLLLLFFGLASAPTAARAAGKPVAMKPGQACLDCHGKLNSKKNIHPATEGGKGCATLCHEQADPARHQFAARPAPIVSLCLACHDNPATGKHRHMPAADGDCTACHDPHQSEQAKLLNAPAGEICLQCHDQGDFSGTVVHGPVAGGDCVACHNPHATDLARLLREPVPALCWRCHDKAQTDTAGISLPPTKPLFEYSKANHHPPFAAGDCNDCHRPHASAEVRLLAAAYPKELYQAYNKTAYALCLNCHEAAAFTTPRTETATAFRNGNLNLHQRHVDKKKGRSCRACHTPHGSAQPRLIAHGFRFGERVLGLTFEATDNGGSCVSNCHIKVSYDRLAPVNNPLRTSPRPGEDARSKESQKPGSGQKK